MEKKNDNPIVSVICLAYNHEKYIRQALDSILSQITSYKYEIIIHDDKSTDNTRKIIEEYEKNFPNIIVPVFETENQYSKGNDVIDISLKHCKGKYIAFCECDDYWNDNNKIQTQVDFMENNKDYSACSSSSIVLDDRTGRESVLFPVEEDIDLTVDDIILWDDRHFQTASLLFRTEYKDMPTEYYIRGISDYPRAVYLCSKGKIRYFHNTMSVYRSYVGGSWTDRFRNNITMQKELLINTKSMLLNISRNSPKEFEHPINQKLQDLEFQLCLIDSNYLELKKRYREQYSKLKIIARFKIITKYYFPNIYSYLKSRYIKRIKK